jgi:2-keto-3-deoxy-L-rhamnonate aldolase RhmA
MRRGFVSRLRDSTAPIGTWVKIPALEPVEILADAGFDFIVVDMEHAPLTFEFAYRATVVAQGAGMHVLVRVPDRSGGALQRLLDAGVDGILVPRVSTVDETGDAVRQMRFSPTGDRGMGLTARAGRWGATSREEYLRWGDEEVFRAVQLEDRGALERADAITAVAGLSGVFLGMGDLQLSTGLPESHPEIEALVDTLLAAAAARGLPVGTAVQTAEEARKRIARGFGFVMVSNDTSLLRGAARTLVEDIHR